MGGDVDLSEVVSAAQVGIWVVGSSGRTLLANRRMADLLLYSPAEMADLSIADAFQAGDAVLLMASSFPAGLGGVPATRMHCLFLRADGAAVWCQVDQSPLHDRTGALVGVVNVVSDITDRLGVDEELRRSKEQLADAQRVGHLGSWEWDLATNSISWSDELYRIAGLVPGETEITNHTFLECVVDEDLDQARATIDACFRGDPRFAFDCRIRRPSGEMVYVHCMGEVLHNEVGRPVLVVGRTLDITKYKVSELRLRQASVRYRLLEAIASIANETADFCDALGLAVTEVCRQSGYRAGRFHRTEASTGRLLAAGAWQFADADAAATVDATGPGEPRVELVGGQLAEEVLDECEVTWSAGPAAGARPVPAQGVGFPVLVAGRVEAVLEFVGCDREWLGELDSVSMWQQVGAQLGRVLARQRSREELAAARDAAVESSRIKSEFLATMSHEIRTPMNAVMGLAELLTTATSLDDLQRQYAEGIQSAGSALLSVINDILDYSKLEAGQVHLEPRDVDPRALVSEVGSLLAPEAFRKGVELVASCRPDVPALVRGDAGRIRQILLNLASNAVRFTAAGEVVIEVTSPEATTEGRVQLRFEVRDTGIGLAAEGQERLFESFRQADASTTRRYGGTGLGLAISQRLVHAMGGRIGVHSRLGRGSTFWCELPVPIATASDRLGPPSVTSLTGWRALVVDDHPASLSTLERQLAEWGIETGTASTAESAQQLVRRAAAGGAGFDVVLLDMSLPGQSGLELAAALRAELGEQSPRVVLMMSTQAVDLEALRGAGVAAWLTKPVSCAALADRLLDLQRDDTGSGFDVAHRAVPPAAGQRTGAGRILVVEDNALNQLVAQGLVASLGYDSDVVSTGHAALEALERSSYVAVLMDCHMPEMDGYQATREIRRREGGQGRTPVIAMTAGVRTEDRELCFAAGMDDYLAKPVSVEAISSALQRWLTPAAAPPPTPTEAPAPAPQQVGAASTIDRSRLSLLSELGDRAESSLVDRVIALYARDSEGSVDALYEAARSHDVGELAEVLHKLVGASTNVGAQRVASLGRDLEDGLRAGDLPGAENLTELATEIGVANVALAAHQVSLRRPLAG